jgi:hypothetical protein
MEGVGGRRSESGIDSKIVYLDASALHARLSIEVHLHLQTNVTDIYYANSYMSVQMIDGQTNVRENITHCFPECTVSAVAAEGLWPGLQANVIVD